MEDYEYEEDLDILYVHNNPNREKPIGNIVLGNIVVDIGNSGRVLGIEFDCASKIFNFSSEQFKELKLAKVQIMKIGTMLTLGVVLATANKEHTFQFEITNKMNEAIAC